MDVARTLILLGVALVLLGVLWLLGEAIGLGRLPGDIVIRGERFTFYFPLATCNMGKGICIVLLRLARLIVALRYRVRVHGWDQVRGLKGPVLLLPNHPGYIEPVLVLATFYDGYRPRPVLYEGFFPRPVLRLLVKLLGAVLIPDLDHPSHQARRRAEQALAEIVAGLRRGENFILWPAGRVQRDGVERLGANRALTDVLRAVPEAAVVLVRTRGMWGSRSTYAWTGKRPQLLRSAVIGLLWLLLNLVFFMPRRRLEVTVEKLDRHQLPGLERDKVNRWFEAWYNAGGPEQPTYVPYHFLVGPRTHSFPPVSAPEVGEIRPDQIHPENRAVVAEMLADRLGRPLAADELHPEMRLEELGLDSLQRMDLALAVEQRFGFSAESAPATVGQLLALAHGLVEKGPPRPAPPEWFRPRSVQGPLQILGETIPDAFVARADLPARRGCRRRRVRCGFLRTPARGRPVAGAPVRRAARGKRRPAAARVGGLRHGVARAVPGGQAAGTAQLDDRPRQPCPRRTADQPHARDHVAAAARPPGHRHRGRAVPGCRRLECPDKLVRAIVHAVEGSLPAPPRSRTSTAGSGRRTGRDPVHVRLREGAQGGAADTPEHPQ